MGVALQASGWISDATRQVSEVKSEIEKHRDFITALEGGSARTALTIATGAITPPARDFGAHITVDTEGAAATDTLSTISTTNCAEGSIVFLWLANTARIVTIQHAAGGAGQITLLDGADFEFPASDDVFVKLQLRSTTWVEIERGFGNSQTAAREFRGPSTPYGFYTTVNATDPTNDIDISAGACWDTTRTVWIEGTAMTKQGDATWAAGTNAGFRDAGSLGSSEGWHIYVMINEDTGAVDYIMSQSGTWAGVTPPNAAWSKGQIIGYAYRDTAWVEMEWSGNDCAYIECRLAFSDSTITDETFETYDFFPVPRSSRAKFSAAVNNSTPTGTVPIYLRPTIASALPFNANTFVGYEVSSTAPPTSIGIFVTHLVDASRQLQMATYEKSGSASLSAYVFGFTLVDRLEATS